MDKAGVVSVAGVDEALAVFAGSAAGAEAVFAGTFVR